MQQPTDTQIRQMLDDLHHIRKVVDTNRDAIRCIFLSDTVKLIALLAGLTAFLFPLVMQWLLIRYGAHDMIPLHSKVLYYTALAAAFIFTGVIKSRSFLKRVRQVDPAYTLLRLMREVYTMRIGHIYWSIHTVMLFLVVYFLSQEIYAPIAHTLCIGIGMHFNVFGMAMRIREYLITGYWCIATALLGLVVVAIPPLVLFALSMGVGMLIMAAIAYYQTSSGLKEK
jgi:hypothetical protein